MGVDVRCQERDIVKGAVVPEVEPGVEPGEGPGVESVPARRRRRPGESRARGGEAPSWRRLPRW